MLLTWLALGFGSRLSQGSRAPSPFYKSNSGRSSTSLLPRIDLSHQPASSQKEESQRDGLDPAFRCSSSRTRQARLPTTLACSQTKMTVSS